MEGSHSLAQWKTIIFGEQNYAEIDSTSFYVFIVCELCFSLVDQQCCKIGHVIKACQTCISFAQQYVINVSALRMNCLTFGLDTYITSQVYFQFNAIGYILEFF